MTYREEIQKLIADIEKVYEKAGWLRDAAMGNDENGAFNKVRDLIRSASSSLRQLDDLLPRERSEMEL